MVFVPFEDAKGVCDRFLQLLSKNEISPLFGSSFEDELLSLSQLIEVAKNPSLIDGNKHITLLRAAAGVHDFAAKVLSVEPLPEFKKFLPHLRLIAQTKFTAASLSQNACSPYNDDIARKMAELYMGCLAAHAGTEVILDSPTKSDGDNPDVIFTAETDGAKSKPQRWALAIKTISSKQGQTIFDRIRDGAKQIDDPKCSAERGMVVINAKNALDHDALWSPVFSNVDVAMDALRDQLIALAFSAAADREVAEWDSLFERRVARPVLFLGQSLVRVTTNFADETPTALKMLYRYEAAGNPDPIADGLASVMNHFMQILLHGIPGDPDGLPS